jgi:hypothetical protein
MTVLACNPYGIVAEVNTRPLADVPPYLCLTIERRTIFIYSALRAPNDKRKHPESTSRVSVRTYNAKFLSTVTI